MEDKEERVEGKVRHSDESGRKYCRRKKNEDGKSG